MIRINLDSVFIILLYFQLGGLITESKETLENALDLAKSLHQDLPKLSDWMDQTEELLDEGQVKVLLINFYFHCFHIMG